MQPTPHGSDRRPCDPLITRLRRPLVVAAYLLVTIAASWAQAQPAVPDEESEPRRGPTWTYASGRTLKLFPGGDLFPIYVADPHRPTNTILVDFTRVDIEDTKSPRFRLSAGGRFGALRIDPPSPGGRSWQISVDAGLDALFDSQNNQDAIGWDGNYGLTVATASGGPLAFKVGLLHTSAHMGDEYADRTGRQRHNYTREEVAVGFSARMGRRWRTYAETGVAYLERYEQQEPWRVQGGVEYESPQRLWGDRFSWFWASDLSSWQERDWRLDTSFQAGIATHSEGRTYRLGIQVHDGRPTVSDFFQYSETSVTLGIWVDF